MRSQLSFDHSDVLVTRRLLVLCRVETGRLRRSLVRRRITNIVPLLEFRWPHNRRFPAETCISPPPPFVKVVDVWKNFDPEIEPCLPGGWRLLYEPHRISE